MNSRSSADRSVVDPPPHFYGVTLFLVQSSHLAVTFWVTVLGVSWLQLKVLDGEKDQRELEAAELQARLTMEEQKEEERGKDFVSLKQKLNEAETARESLKREVSMNKRVKK